jgi:hypothetical protein
MQVGRPKGANRLVGKAQGYMGLPIKDDMIDCPVNGPNTPRMTTAWIPTPEEIAKLVMGASVHVKMLGRIPPPMLVEVGDVPESAEELAKSGKCMLCGGDKP